MGRILLIASITGKEGHLLMAGYSATKAGVIGLAKTCGQGICASRNNHQRTCSSSYQNCYEWKNLLRSSLLIWRQKSQWGSWVRWTKWGRLPLGLFQKKRALIPVSFSTYIAEEQHIELLTKHRQAINCLHTNTRSRVIKEYPWSNLLLEASIEV